MDITKFDLKNKTYIMGILNVTPDSFSDGGRWNGVQAALDRARKMAAEGADIIDVGGESTRPGYTPVSEEEEIGRVLPVIERIKGELDIPVSVDTCKAGVAYAALKAGADMVNDIWGFKGDKDMARVAAEFGAACCLMHNRERAEYSSFISEVKDDLQESVNIALRAGVKRENIILDPGIGFAKSPEQNLMVLNRLEDLYIGYPMLVGASRKSLIGYALNVPVEDREEASVACAVIAARGKFRKITLLGRVENERQNKFNGYKGDGFPRGILRRKGFFASLYSGCGAIYRRA